MAVVADPRLGPATPPFNGLSVPLPTRARGQNEGRKERVAERPNAKPQHLFLLLQVGD